MIKLAVFLVACGLAAALAEEGPACPPVCSLACPFGAVLDSNGCRTCSCNPPPATECRGRNQLYNECGSPCPLACNSITGQLSGGPTVSCPEMCVSGCFCADGFAVDDAVDGVDDESVTCMLAAECTADLTVGEPSGDDDATTTTTARPLSTRNNIVGEGETCNGSLPPQYSTHCAAGLTCVRRGGSLGGSSGICTAEPTTVPASTDPAAHCEGGCQDGWVCNAIPIYCFAAPCPEVHRCQQDCRLVDCMDIRACPDGSNPSRSEDQCCASCDATEPVTEEPVECPPNCEMVCANGFVMEEGCPVCECVAAAVCVVEGVVYEDGAVWDDESGPCTQHTCVDGRVMTSMQSCVPPFLQEPCAGNAELVSVEGQCCEECPEATTVVPGSCSRDGATYRDGTTWAHLTDPCTSHTCFSGEIATMSVDCNFPECPDGADPIHSTGQCCPTCPDAATARPLSTRNNIVGEGETCNGSLPPQYSTHCAAGLTCVRRGGSLGGSSGICTAEPPTVPARQPCVDDGVRHESGSEWAHATDPCSHHTCQDGRVLTRTQSCPRPMHCTSSIGEEWVVPAGQCCGACRRVSRPQCAGECEAGWVCNAVSLSCDLESAPCGTESRCQQDCRLARCAATSIMCSDGSAGIVPQDTCCPNCDHVTMAPEPTPSPIMAPTTSDPTPGPAVAPATSGPPSPIPTTSEPTPANAADGATSKGSDDEAGMSSTSIIVIIVATLLILAVIAAVVIVQRATASKTDHYDAPRAGLDAFANPTYGEAPFTFKQGATTTNPEGTALYEHAPPLGPDNDMSNV